MIESAKDFVARIWVAGLVSAALGIGGVWFVVEQSLETLRGHVASIDQRMEQFVTKREFDQFLLRFDRLEQKIDTEFEETRRQRASLATPTPDERSERILPEAPRVVLNVDDYTVELVGVPDDRLADAVASARSTITEAVSVDASMQNVARTFQNLGYSVENGLNTLTIRQSD